MKTKTKPDLYVGTWAGIDEFSSNVEYTIRKIKGGYSAKVIDAYDSEKADVFEEVWDKRKSIFSFSAHWNSTGRFMRCKMRLITPEKMGFTYTYTDSETLLRKQEK